MLKKSDRLDRDLVKNLLATGGFFHTGHFLLRTASAPRARLGVSVSKKVSKLASARNRTRRRVYAAAAPLLPSLAPKHYLVVAKSGAQKLRDAELRTELAVLLKKG